MNFDYLLECAKLLLVHSNMREFSNVQLHLFSLSYIYKYLSQRFFLSHEFLSSLAHTICDYR